MPRGSRDPTHPTLFDAGEVPAAPVARPRLRAVSPTAALVTSSETDLAQLIVDLLRRSALAQIACSRIDEGAWRLLSPEFARFSERGGVASVTVGRLFELPRAAGMERNVWRTTASAALERGLRLCSGLLQHSRVYLWPRFQGSVALFDAGSALHALVGSTPFTERALRRTDAPESREATATPMANAIPGRCDATLHLSATDTEWAGGLLDLEERASCVAALYRFYSFFNADVARRGPDPLHELSPRRIDTALSELTRVVDWVTEMATGGALDAATLEVALLRRLVELDAEEERVDVTFQPGAEDGVLRLDAAARPLIEAIQRGPATVTFRMPQPRHDFVARVQPTAEGDDAPLSVIGTPRLRLNEIVRRGHLRLGEVLVLARQGRNVLRVVPYPSSRASALDSRRP